MPTTAEPAGAQVCDLSKPGAEGHPHRSESEIGQLDELDLTPHLLRCGVGDIYVMLSLASSCYTKQQFFLRRKGTLLPNVDLEVSTMKGKREESVAARR